MRRSQMLELIIYETMSYDGFHEEINVEELAENMLACAERHGMLPPAKEGKVVVQEIDGELVLPLWAWEAE